jgi:hypothetical protein
MMMDAEKHIFSAFEVSIQWCKKGQHGVAFTWFAKVCKEWTLDCLDLWSCYTLRVGPAFNHTYGKQESEQEHVDYSCALFGLEWQLFACTSQFGSQCESIVRDLPKTREAWKTGTGFGTLRLEAFKSKCHGPWISKIWLQVELDLRQRWQRLRFLDVTVDDCQVNLWMA